MSGGVAGANRGRSFAATVALLFTAYFLLQPIKEALGVS